MKEEANEKSDAVQSEKHFLKVLIKNQPCENNFYYYHAKMFMTWPTIFVKLTPILVCSASSLQLISEDDHDISERFVTLLYDRASICTGVNQLRSELFSKKNRIVENIPPALDALHLHIKRAQLQSRWVT